MGLQKKCPWAIIKTGFLQFCIEGKTAISIRQRENSISILHRLVTDEYGENYWFNGIWEHYTDYVCVLATNGSCCFDFLDRAKQLNPDFAWLSQMEELYRRTGRMRENDNGNDLESIGGGFNIKLETLQDKNKRERITKVIRKRGDCMDEVIQIIICKPISTAGDGIPPPAYFIRSGPTASLLPAAIGCGRIAALQILPIKIESE